MSTNGPTERPGALRGRPTVPWSTVVPLATVLAFADGFWMMSLRGAVGAAERTQEPFANWLRESTLALPVFVFAVLAALTLALRLFGPVLRRPRTVVATALMVVAAGTLVGIAELAVGAAYEYHLQAAHLQVMGSMRTACADGGCLALQEQAALGLQLRAVTYGSGMLLGTNLALVGWVVAIRGGRIDVTRTRPRPAHPRTRPGPLGQRTAAPRATEARALHRVHGSRVDDLRLLLAAGLFGSAAIHAAVVPEHLAEWAAGGVFFIVLLAAELVVAALLISRVQPAVLLAAAVVSIGPLAVWLYSRTIGMPFGPEAGVPEQVGLPDGAAGALEVGTLLVAVLLLGGRGWFLRRSPASEHVRWLSLVGVIVVTAIGLTGSGLSWFAVFGSTSVSAH